MSVNKRLKKKRIKQLEEKREKSEEVKVQKAEDGGHEIEQESNSSMSEKAEESKGGKGNRKRKIVKIAVGATAAVLVGVYLGGIIYFQNNFFLHTTINEIEAGKSTVEEVEDIIRNQVQRYKIVLKERGGEREYITADQIDYRYVSKKEVQGFLQEQKPYTWPLCLWQNYSYQFDSSIEFDKEQLKKSVKELSCFSKKVEKEPKDAYMEFQDTLFQVVEEEEGKKVKEKKLLTVLEKIIDAGERFVDLEKENCYAKPAIRKENQELQNLTENLNAYAKTNITYMFGEKEEILDGKVIKEWLSYDSYGNVTLDEEQVFKYVIDLAEKYDTYEKIRNLKTNNGTYVNVEGGHYGWKIDQEAEAEEVLELVKRGAKRRRTARFAKTAVSWENSDLGYDYVEIDLTNQHLWMYVGGEEVVSSDLVSGDLSRRGRKTPPGTFTLYYKKSPAVLRSNTPGDSYESPVTYWMPFNGGIGLHDANWRGSFGGEIYKYSGSHGCINLPTSAAKEIYQQIYTGMPIICYYR